MSGEKPGEIVVQRQHAPMVIPGAHILAEGEFDRIWRMAKALAASGMFKDVTQAEQAFGRILLGRDLGLTPTQALMSIDVVRGNVQVRAVRLAAWVRQHPDYDYAIVEHDADHCVIDFYYRGEIAGQSAFSVEDAKAAKIWKADGPWGAHPRNMVFSRAMSNGAKWFCPDVTGGIPVYTEADVFEGTAVEIGAGEGDGSEPGWDGLTDEQVADLEALLTIAADLGRPLPKAVVQMRLNGKPEDVEAFIADTNDMLAKRKEAVVAEEAGQQTLGGGEK